MNKTNRSLRCSGDVPQHVQLQHGMMSVKVANYSMLIRGAHSPAESTVGSGMPLQSKGYFCKVSARVRQEGVMEGGGGERWRIFSFSHETARSNHLRMMVFSK